MTISGNLKDISELITGLVGDSRGSEGGVQVLVCLSLLKKSNL